MSAAGAGGGTPGSGPPGGGPGGGGGGGGGGGKTPKDKDKEKEKDGKTPGRSGKKVPSNFVEVIDTLVDLVLRYEGPYSESKPKDPSTGALWLMPWLAANRMSPHGKILPFGFLLVMVIA